ncbi:hypothetical protein BH09PLA1_BH09PLA1_06810 [soil metagenome]
MQAPVQIHTPGVLRRKPSRLERSIGDRLTGSRLRFTAASTIVVASLLLALSFATTRDNRTAAGPGLGSDYLAFYDAGTILNQHSLDRLYDLNLQAELYHQHLPGEAENASLPYANAPFLAMMLRPLALLSYAWSYAAWISLSLLMFAAAFALMWKSAGLPNHYRGIALLCALSFEPFLIECLHGGQVSAFGLIWISLAIYYSLRGRQWSAGLALALCVYKPTLLPLILPMLLITRQWRTLGGFAIGTAVLAMVSLAAVGSNACVDYLHLLVGYFGKSTSAGGHGLQIWKFIDLNSFLKLLGIPSSLAWAMIVCVGAMVLRTVWNARPKTADDARRMMPFAWSAAITWTLVLNVYVGVYDAVLVIPSILLTCAGLIRRNTDTGRHLPLRFRCLLVLIWALPWVSGLIAREFGLQPFTLALLTLGIYQLHLLQTRAGRKASVTRRNESRRASDMSNSLIAEAASPAMAVG